MSLATEVTDLVLSGRIVTALEKGYAATSDKISDVLDSALQGAIPAYATAMDVAEQAGESSGIDIDSIRHKIFREVSETVGLAKLIHALVDAWHKIPAVLRQSVGAAVAVGGSVKQFFADPSFENFLYIGQSIGQLGGAVCHLIGDGAKFASKALVKGAEWMYDYGSKAADAVANLLERIGEKVLAKLVSTIYTEAGAVIEAGLGIIAGDIKSVWNAAKRGDILAVGDEILDSAVSAPGDIAEGIYSGGKKVAHFFGSIF